MYKAEGDVLEMRKKEEGDGKFDTQYSSEKAIATLPWEVSDGPRQ